VLHGRYTGRPTATVSIRAKAGDRDVTLPVATKRAATQGSENVLGSLWARAKVGSLEAVLWDGWNGAAERDITKLGLDFHLVTRFTSLLAVDNARRVGDGAPQTIMQPLDEPEGVDVGMAGGQVAQYGGEPTEQMEAQDESAPPEPEILLTGPLAGAPAIRSQSGQRRGCSCRLAEASAPGTGVWIGLAAIGILVARRKARSGAAPA
jgi:Ca-activated chloride channel family protein